MAPDPVVAAAINALGATLLAHLTAPDLPPPFVSPASVASALALLAAGASGESAVELEAVLGGGVDGVAALAGAALSSSAPRATVDAANGVWAALGLQFSDEYLAAVSSLGAVARALTGAAEVNAWVSAATRGRVRSILPDAVAARAAVVLVNALYFKADWEAAFDARASGPLAFSRGRGRPPVSAHAMRRVFKRVHCACTPALTAVRLPYAGGEFEAVVALPADARAAPTTLLPALLALDACNGWEIPPSGVAVTLPRFSVEAGADLKSALAAAGVRAPFARGADLAPMLAGAAPPPVTDVLHKVCIDVDEKGTEAAAATAIATTRAILSFPEPFTADRPFFFGVRHVASGLYLFAGGVDAPVEWKEEGRAGGARGGNPAPAPGGLAPPGATEARCGSIG